MILGKCPYCDASVIARKFETQGKKIKLYTCENAEKKYDESEAFVFTAESSCTFRVYSNTFLKWNKRSFSQYEMRKLLQDGQTTIRLHGRKGTGEYFKYVITDKEYGVSILWDEDVPKEDEEEELIS